MEPQQKKRKRSKRSVSDTLLHEIQEYFKKYQFEIPQLQLSRNKEVSKEVFAAEKVNRWTISLRNGDQHVTIRSNEPDPIRTSVKNSVVFWVDHGGKRTAPQHVLCQLPWIDTVNTLRRKVFQAMVKTNQLVPIIVHFLHSQLVGRVVVQQQETVQQEPIDFHTVVLDFFGKSSLAKVLLTHMLKQKKPKKLGLVGEPLAYKNSCTYWYTGEKRGILLCETKGIDASIMQCFAALPENDDIKARFAMSQLVGYPVSSWLDVIDKDNLPQLQLDVSMVPGNQTMSLSGGVVEGGVVEASLFVLVKKMLGIPTLAPEPNPLQIVQDQLGIYAARRCFYLGDFSAPTFAQSTIVLPKSQAESHHNLKYLCLENLRSTSFYISLLSNFTKGAFELRLDEDIVVDIRLVKYNGITRYVCGFVRELPKFDLPSEVPHQFGTLSAKKLASWAFQVLRYFAGDEGTLAQMVDLYKEHAWFCIWDLKEETFEASHVYASDAYVQKFGPQQHMYAVFGEAGYSTSFIWKGLLQPLLQGRTSRLHRDVMREGKMCTYILRYFRSKSKRFYVLVVEEKHNYNLPLHLEQERKEMDGSSTILAALRWGFKVMKWFRRPSSSATLEQVKSQYKGIFIITDLSLSDFERSLHYSDKFVQCFGDIVRLSTNIRTSSNAMHVMWNVILRPIWSGRIPEIERDIVCKDGVSRTFTITFHTDALKQFYTAVLVEKTPEIDATDALIGSAIEEEVPTDFRGYDIREWMHKMVRLIKRYPTDVHDPEQCQQVLEKMIQDHGPESYVQMFLIHDMHVADWLQSLVYRSKKHAEYYGDYTTIMQRVKTNTLTFGNFLPRLHQLVTGNAPSDEAMILRVNDVEVDTVRLDIIQDTRYIGCVITILSTKRYRPPKMQDWDSAQEDSQDDTEEWSFLKLFQ